MPDVERRKKCLWFVPDSKWNHHVFHAERGRNTTRGRLLPSNALAVRQNWKQSEPFFFFFLSYTSLFKTCNRNELQKAGMRSKGAAAESLRELNIHRPRPAAPVSYSANLSESRWGVVETQGLQWPHRRCSRALAGVSVSIPSRFLNWRLLQRRPIDCNVICI